jgi:Kef-type K+ transport system membrane component KefB/mannitol/fructose-specific phosphotransferase system IIA component
VHSLQEEHIFILLIQVFLLLGLSRGLGELFRRWNQPPVTAEILVGVALGPTLLGRLLPSLYGALFPQDPIQQSIFDIIAWLGVLFFLLDTGLEIDFASAWKQKGTALTIAAADLVVPLAAAFVASLFLPDRYLIDPAHRLIFVSFLATVLAISAMPVAARILHDLNLTKTDFGLLVMSSLTIKDIAGWLIFASLLGFAGKTEMHAATILSILAATIGFSVLCLTFGRSSMDFVFSRFKKLRLPEQSSSLTFIVLLGVLCGAITQKIGIHALFGFFIAGIMAGEAKALSERTRQTISQVVHAVFVPLFFAGIGLKIDFLSNFDILLVSFVCAVGMAGRFLGAWIGAAFTMLPKADRLNVSILHVPGGAMEIVVGIIALQYNLISQPVFVAIVFGAVFSSAIVGPLLSYSLGRRKKISILEFFSPAGIIEGIQSKGRTEAIRELCEAARRHDPQLDVEHAYKEVLRRERLMGTAIEEGIAVPHAFIPSLRKSIIIFGRAPEGIEWNSPDGQLTRFIFLLLTPSESADFQTQVVGAIARTMINAQMRNDILSAKDAQEIWKIMQAAFAPHHVEREPLTVVNS